MSCHALERRFEIDALLCRVLTHALAMTERAVKLAASGLATRLSLTLAERCWSFLDPKPVSAVPAIVDVDAYFRDLHAQINQQWRPIWSDGMPDVRQLF